MLTAVWRSSTRQAESDGSAAPRKIGQREIRRLLIIGAMAVIQPTANNAGPKLG